MIIILTKISQNNNLKNKKGGNKANNFVDEHKNKNFGLTDYAVKLFTKWNEMDPPDEFEISMNNKLYEIQGNKNPFIDHPEYVNAIWGNPSKTNLKSQKMDNINFKEFSKFLQFPKKSLVPYNHPHLKNIYIYL